jgi:hypothetical protein
MKFLFSKLFVWPFLAWANGRGRNLGTEWEPDGNVKGTCWEQRKNVKTSSPHQNLKEKKSRHFECMLSLPIDFPFAKWGAQHYRLYCWLTCSLASYYTPQGDNR